MNQVTDDKRSEQQAALKERCRRTYRYLIHEFEDRNCRDSVARDVWWEQYHWLKKCGWWHFRILLHWVRDRDHIESQKLYYPGYKRCGMHIMEWALSHLLDPDPLHRPHRAPGGSSSDRVASRSEAAAARKRRERDE